KKFSDSVKSTFRHFKDTTKNIFDEKGNKRFGATKEAAEKPRTVFSDYLHPQYKAPTENHHNRGPAMQNDGRKEKPVHFKEFRKNTNSKKCSPGHDCRENSHSFRKACSGVFDCAQQESMSLFNTVVNPIRMDEFRQIIQSRPDKKQRMVNIENSRHRKQEQKHLQPQPYKREGKWHKYGRTNGRQMANLEIELGQLPFDPQY
ncbi:CCPG1 isoform 11, partial [Pan troglodytes]